MSCKRAIANVSASRVYAYCVNRSSNHLALLPPTREKSALPPDPESRDSVRPSNPSLSVRSGRYNPARLRPTLHYASGPHSRAGVPLFVDAAPLFVDGAPLCQASSPLLSLRRSRPVQPSGRIVVSNECRSAGSPGGHLFGAHTMLLLHRLIGPNKSALP